jgi:GntR family transcriptional regulator
MPAKEDVMFTAPDLEHFRQRPLDRNVPVPIYFQLMEILQDYINDHENNFPIPPENDLCAVYGISRPTVRQAINELVGEGLITRYKGRGSFINKKKIMQNFLLTIASFNDEMQSKGLKPETKVLSFCPRKTTLQIIQKLQIRSEDELYYLSRLRSINNEPIVLVNTYLPGAIVPGILGRDMGKESLYHVIENEYGHQIVRTHRTIEIRYAGNYEASLLKIKEKEPVHYTETVAYIEDGRPIEYSTAYYVGDRNKFTIEVRTDKGRPA